MVRLPINVLVVDDERDFAESLSERLEVAGHRSKTVFAGEQALAALAEDEIDVVILDLKMPGMDGMEVLRRIKNDYPLVEVLLLTGHADVASAVEGMKTGAFDYLQKPTDHGELLTKLEAARTRKADHEERIRRAEARALIRKTGDI